VCADIRDWVSRGGGVKQQ